MKLFIILAAAALAGCASTNGFNNTEVVVSKEYVVRTAPDTLKTLPPLPPRLANPRTATNQQVATFINNTEEYVANLESMIQTLVNFYERPVTTGEVAAAGAMTAVTPRAQATPTTGRVIQPQTTAGASGATATTSGAAAAFTTPLQRAATR